MKKGSRSYLFRAFQGLYFIEADAPEDAEEASALVAEAGAGSGSATAIIGVGATMFAAGAAI